MYVFSPLTVPGVLDSQRNSTEQTKKLYLPSNLNNRHLLAACDDTAIPKNQSTDIFFQKLVF